MTHDQPPGRVCGLRTGRGHEHLNLLPCGAPSRLLDDEGRDAGGGRMIPAQDDSERIVGKLALHRRCLHRERQNTRAEASGRDDCHR